MSKSTPRDFNIVRILGPRQRIFGGWKRQDRVLMNEKELKGHIDVVRSKGETKETTVFPSVKNGVQTAPGFDWVWLAKRNGRHIKIAVPTPEYKDAA